MKEREIWLPWNLFATVNCIVGDVQTQDEPWCKTVAREASLSASKIKNTDNQQLQPRIIGCTKLARCTRIVYSTISQCDTTWNIDLFLLTFRAHQTENGAWLINLYVHTWHSFNSTHTGWWWCVSVCVCRASPTNTPALFPTLLMTLSTHYSSRCDFTSQLAAEIIASNYMCQQLYGSELNNCHNCQTVGYIATWYQRVGRLFM